VARGLGRGPGVPRRERLEETQVLRDGDVPLSVGTPPRRPRPQLRDGRRRCALQARAGLQRAASDGLGRLRAAGRERRRRARRRPVGMDLQQHRRHARGAGALGGLDRLVARVRYLRSGILRQAAGLVPAALEEGAGLPQGGPGQLGPGRHDRPGQRAGDRRPRVALGRDCRAQEADPVVPAHHRLRRRVAGGAENPGSLA